MSIVELRSVPTTAEAWCARLDADDVTDADRAAFKAWLNAAAENRAEYELAALAVAVSRGLSARSEMQQEAASVGRRSFAPKLAVAAGLASLLLGSGWITWRASVPDYSTAVGEQEAFALEDGSTVELNTMSAMNVEIERDVRHVTLNRGEAFFNVVPDPARPFIVHAANSEIRVVGTRFNVRIVDGTARVTVLEGRVKVAPRELPMQRTREPAAAHAIDLRPGQTASIPPQQFPARMDSLSAAQVTAWREGKLYFSDDSLAEVLQEVNRYTSTPFVMSDPAHGSLKLSGVFRTGDVESVAFALRVAHSLNIEHQDDRIVIR